MGGPPPPPIRFPPRSLPGQPGESPGLPLVSVLPVDWIPEFVAAAGEGPWVYLGGVRGLTTLELDPEGRLSPRGHLESVGRGHRVVLAGSRLLVSDLDGGVSLLSREVPGAPRLLERAFEPTPSFGLAVGGGRLYRAVGSRGLAVGPWPAEGRLAAPPALHAVGDARDVLVTPEGAVVVGLASGGIRILRPGPGGALALEGSLKLPGKVSRLALTGSDLLVALGSDGLARVDLARPGRPALLARLDLPFPALDLAVAGDRVAVAGWAGVARLRLEGRGVALEAAGPLHLRDMRGMPGLVMSALWSGRHLLAVEWGSVFVLQADGGRVVEEPPASPAMSASAPAFDLARIGGGRVRLADYRGRPLFLYFFAEG